MGRFQTHLLFAVVAVLSAGCSVVTRVDVPITPARSTGSATPFAISYDGRWVGFETSSPNLVAGDTNGTGDVFLRDRLSGTTERMSVRPDGGQIAAFSFAQGMDESGERILFTTSASLVPADVNNRTDLYVRDRSAEPSTYLVSVDTAGVPLVGPTSDVTVASISSNGRYVAFTVQEQSHLVPGKAYVRDIVGQTVGVTTEFQGPADLRSLTVSGDGKHHVVVPWSASGPNPGPVFVDPAGSTFSTRNFCVGVGIAVMSEDTRFVGLTQGQPGSGCVNIDRPMIWDRQADTLIALSAGPTGSVRISGADRNLGIIALTDSSVFDHQVVVGDRYRNTLRTVSSGTFGEIGNGPSNVGLISGNGRSVVFASTATNLTATAPSDAFDHLYVKDAVVPIVTGAAPSSVRRGSTTFVTLRGSLFSELSTVLIDGANVNGVTVMSDTELRVAVFVPTNAIRGPRNIWIFNGSSAALCSGCLTVT